VKWVEPGQVQKRVVDIYHGDILANLPYSENCSMWFDHHYSNRIETPFKGAFEIAPSAAGVVYNYYKKDLKNDYTDLVKAADKIDSADLSMDEVVYPEKFPYVILSMTISSNNATGESYWNKLVDLLRKEDILKILEDEDVTKRCREVIDENKLFREYLVNYTQLKRHVSITDFRSFEKEPSGNRFLVYSLFPETVVSLRVRYDDNDKEKVRVSIGHSIFNRNCNVNIGLMLSKYEGGGHREAGACSLHVSEADQSINEIVEELLKNESNDRFYE
jgi:oligoribonuclease NrnB/cAMP/cGMP phosphodiesterase (DHH superfamily)